MNAEVHQYRIVAGRIQRTAQTYLFQEGKSVMFLPFKFRAQKPCFVADTQYYTVPSVFISSLTVIQTHTCAKYMQDEFYYHYSN